MIQVVLCGTYRRDSDGLARSFEELETNGCRILSPISVDFTKAEHSFVKTSSEQNFTIDELERFHTRAMHDADFIWLHDPQGYIGSSACYEIGYAAALAKPVFARELPDDAMLQTRVTVVRSVFEALLRLKSITKSTAK